MDPKESKTGKTAVPLYTKIGWIAAWVVMLGLAMMIMRNCATSVFYGLRTDQQTVDSYYQQGISDGRTGENQKLQGEAAENSVLRKAYIKGYREGRDQGINPEEKGD